MECLKDKKLDELEKVISEIEKLAQFDESNAFFTDIQQAIAATSIQVNTTLYLVPEIEIQDVLTELGIAEGDDDPGVLIDCMIRIWRQSIERRRNGKIENMFWSTYEYFKYVDVDTIVANAIRMFQSYPQDIQELYIELPVIYTFLPGKIDVNTGDYSLIRIYAEMMKENVESFRRLYERLADYRSKQILLRIVRFWFIYDLKDLGELHETVFLDYFDQDLLRCDQDEVLVDCGAYEGDSIQDYISVYGKRNYKRIYAYEIVPQTMERMKNNLAEYENVIYCAKGVSNKNGEMYLDDTVAGQGARISDTGKTRVEVVTLDEDVQEPVTLIKMDIEGAEKEALEGARKHIINERPRLLISTYHCPEDLFRIPEIIDEMRDDYKYYLRFNGRGIWPYDHVLFAL